ncbi:trehalose-phosphatase [Aerophototrophica crusticola]|uniref:Trehalose 6-phosphate phosphatase n=1 Tax=Aerophototrophica crusticola TaxID=1709002 RepID=A0A858R5C6_9PROT|nr:trehalose-phosphatase [Rhodospirillaceae bacterium B3]
MNQTPAALDDAGLTRLAREIAAANPVFFLDYDGTLTPIMPRPEMAQLDPDMRLRVERLAGRCPVAVVSGRDLENVRQMVGIPGIAFAGSHGLDIDAPSGRQRLGEPFRPALKRAIPALEGALAGIEGALVEPKLYAVTVHTRLVDPALKPRVGEVVHDVLAGEPTLRHMAGKEMHELRPELDWDKGKAILHLIEAEGWGGHYPVVLGDDVTDEDAFIAVKGRGLGIRVDDGSGRPTAATVVLPDIPSVGRFLDAVVAALG